MLQPLRARARKMLLLSLKFWVLQTTLSRHRQAGRHGKRAYGTHGQATQALFSGSGLNVSLNKSIF